MSAQHIVKRACAVTAAAFMSLVVVLLLFGAAVAEATPNTLTQEPAPAKVGAAPLNPDFVLWQARRNLDAVFRSVDGHGLGARPAPHALFSADAAPAQRSTRGYASSFDLRTTGKLTSVKDQDPWGTCWSFATYGSMESCLLPGESRDFSEDHMVLTSGFDMGSDGRGQSTTSAATSGCPPPTSPAGAARSGNPRTPTATASRRAALRRASTCRTSPGTPRALVHGQRPHQVRGLHPRRDLHLDVVAGQFERLVLLQPDRRTPTTTTADPTRTTPCWSSAGTTTTRRATSRPRRRATAPSSSGTAGARASARAATSTSPTTTRSSDATQLRRHLRGRPVPDELRHDLPVRPAGRGHRFRRRRHDPLGRQPVHRRRRPRP